MPLTTNMGVFDKIKKSIHLGENRVPPQEVAHPQFADHERVGQHLAAFQQIAQHDVRHSQVVDPD